MKPIRSLCGLGLSGAAACLALGWSTNASAQTLPAPERDTGWGTVSTVSAAVGATSQLLMPRVAYSQNEATIGWKARWHLSVLAPTMTLATIALVNETVVKPGITSFRPGCGTSNVGVAGCEGFAMPSTHSMVAFQSLGFGTGVFLVDTFKWSDGRFGAANFIGRIGLPLVAATFTAIGRVAGTPAHNHFDQMAVGGGVGLLTGFATGLAFGYLQRPECGYSGGVICW